jgi:hypothetical protein
MGDESMSVKPSLMIAGIGLLLATVPAVAHHAFDAEFDVKKPIKVQGTVTKVEWVNPHVWVFLDVKGPDGTVVNWAFEGGAPNAMFRRGVKKSSVPPGMVIVIEGYQAKSGKPVASGKDITFPDGQTLPVGGSSASQR